MAVEARWWTKGLDETTRAQRVSNTAQRLWRDQDALRTNMVRCARLYGNLPIMGLSPRLYRTRGAMAGTWNRLALNVVKSVTDSYVAMLTKDKPKVTFVTSGGDYDLQDKAEQAEKFVDGVFYEADVYELAQQLALDSAIFPFGVVKLFDEEDEDGHHLAIQRIFPWEVLADEEEAAYGSPKTLYHVKWVDKTVLKEAYPESADGIETTRGASFEDNPGDARDSETVELVAAVEAWHLPTKKSPGMHVITIGDQLLLEEKWERPTFPFEFLYRHRPIMGIWGISLAEELAGIQREINILLQKIQRAHHLLSAAHWLVEEGSGIPTNQLDNNIGSIIRYRGTKPEAVTPTAVNPEVYEHLDRLYQRAFEIIGISQQAAQSQKPAGLNSGKAILAYADIQTQRFQPCYREFQSFFLRMARQVIALADQISKKDSSFGVKAPGKNMMSVIKWLDVHMREEEFVLKLYPTNALADEPAARMQQVEDMAAAGWIDPMAARRLLDFPDLEEFNNHEMASYKATTGIITKILKEGKFLPPEPFMNLQESVKLVQNAYLDARNRGAREERLALLLTWLEQADAMLHPPPDPNAPPPQAAAPPGAPPPAGQPPMPMAA